MNASWTLSKKKALRRNCAIWRTNRPNLAKKLFASGINVLGTSADDIDRAESRDRFIEVLTKLGIPMPDGETVYSFSEAVKVTDKLGYPVLVRPSYVLGGRPMEIVYDENHLKEYMSMAIALENEHAILMEQIYRGQGNGNRRHSRRRRPWSFPE